LLRFIKATSWEKTYLTLYMVRQIEEP